MEILFYISLHCRKSINFVKKSRLAILHVAFCQVETIGSITGFGRKLARDITALGSHFNNTEEKL